MSRLPLSPPSEPGSPRSTEPVPLDSSIRTTPIHPQLREIRVPAESLPPNRYNPVTCLPLDSAEIRPQLQRLRKEYPSTTAILKAQEDAVREIKRRMEDAERKRIEVQKALDKKIKERDTELKVLSKYQEVKASEFPS